ncbi:serine protease inhibitor I/II-like [Copidosoma floridanum]|uniref:serine protease inhibitor I/II-like n=1 Tax=Copidosoma floridanum TaxID=29053 RepID=UPI0006C9E28A|nr:serine protease inhibitor I/II-like [Copidosoma floridanum]
MSRLYVFVLYLIVVATDARPEALDSTIFDTTTPNVRNCEPGEMEQKDGLCNYCICNKEGTNKACTKNPCTSELIKSLNQPLIGYPVYKQGDPCLEYTLFYSDCNRCICRGGGNSAHCTLDNCSG